MFTPNEGREPNPTEADIVAAIDAAMSARNQAQPRRQYLGASRIGEACERRLGYEYHQIPKDEGCSFTGKTLRIFDMGHDGESRMADYLKVAGFELITHKEDGKQIAVEDAAGRIKGHLDGVLISGPVKLPYPCLWENKALGEKSWKDVVKHGLRKSKPVYFVQMQLYMGYHELSNGVFTALNRDTGEIYVELVPFDARSCQDSIDKAVRIVSSGNPEELGRAGRGMDDFTCKFCDYKQTCWSRKLPTQTPNTNTINPSWLRKE